jgi:hypothetical protein
MKFQEVLKKVIWNDVKNVLYNYYYKENENYEEEICRYFEVFNKLLDLTPKESNKMRICIENIANEEDSFVSVYGKNGSLNKDSSDFEFWGNVSEEVANAELTYALEFRSWEEWLDMEVTYEVIKEFSMPEIIAHSLYEMTFVSYDQEIIQERFDGLKKTVEDIKNGNFKGEIIDTEELKKLMDDLDEDFDEDKYKF